MILEYSLIFEKVKRYLNLSPHPQRADRAVQRKAIFPRFLKFTHRPKPKRRLSLRDNLKSLPFLILFLRFPCRSLFIDVVKS